MDLQMLSGPTVSILRAIALVAAFVATILSFSFVAIAQERGFQPGAAYAISDIEAINTDNGNMILKVPLAGLPAGRGGVPGTQVSLVYNSKLYETHTETIPDEGTGQPVTQIFLNPSDLGGWRYDFGNFYELRLESRMNKEGQYPCVCGRDFQKNQYIWKLMVIFPDGGEHEFRPLGFNDSLQDGYFDVDPNGVGYAASCVGPISTDPPAYSCNFGTYQATTGGMTYYSTDGTFMRLHVPHSSSGNWRNNWTVSFPDGRRLITANGLTTMFDRNNNVLETGLEDALGRKITMQSDGTEDRFTVTGANGQPLQWIVRWKNVYVSRQYEATEIQGGRERGTSSIQVATNEARVVDRITLPSQAGSLTYVFGYSGLDSDPFPGFSPGWGEVTSIKLPTGAQVNYTWQFDDSNVGSNVLLTRPPKWEWILTNHPVRKDLTYLQQYDGTEVPVTETWRYLGGALVLNGTLSVVAPDGSRTSSTTFSKSSNSPFGRRTFKMVHADGSMTEKVWAENRPQGVPDLALAVNPYVQTELTSIQNAQGDFVKTAIKDYKYDKNGNVTRIDEYDWIDASQVERDTLGRPKPLSQWQWQGYTAFLKKTSTHTYYASTPDATDTTTNSGNVYYSMSAPLLRSAIKDTEVSLGALKFSRSEFVYDNALTTGNVTQLKAWDSAKGAYSNPLLASNSISVSTQYNQYGSPTMTTDARNVQTETIYGLVGNVFDLYPTEVRTAVGTTVQRTEKRAYDFNTGLVTKVTDADNSVSTITSYDDLGRAVLVRAAADKPEETQTSTQYFDAERRKVVRLDLHTKGDGKLVTIEHYDQLGRVRLSRQVEEFSAAALTNETIGIKVQTRYFIDNPCHPTNAAQCLEDNDAIIASYVLTSNPYRAATSDDAGAESTMGWTRARTDRRGRAIETKTFAGSDLPAPWEGNNASTGSVATFYDGMFTTVTDPGGKVRRNQVDALGRLVRVDEPDKSNNLGSTDGPLQPTNYTYDPLDNLTGVAQGAQIRSFKYTSLSRLREATNPESGIVTYEYDENGNLKTRIDPRLLPGSSTRITTIHEYDKLNRLISRTYNDGTPNVTYEYDDVDVANSRGLLTKVSSSVSSYSYGEYDSLGRVKTGTQATAGQPYDLSYEYNAAGSLISQKYPSGRVVKYDYDNAGRFAGVKNNVTGLYYAGAASTDSTNRVQYSAAGAIQAMRLGNGLWEHTNFNSRLQPIQIGLGSTSANSTVLQLDYDYGVTNNNGNVQRQTITVPTLDGVTGFTASQIYSYDELNRLASANENNGSSWRQNYDYDRYGNRRLISGTTLPAALGPANNPIIDANNNRIDDKATGQTTILYDNAGGLTRDVSSHTYQYDAEGKLVSYDGGSTAGGASYSYDGDGRRVKKVVGGSPSITTVYVYDIKGLLIAEYSDAGPTGTGVSYLTSDTLGSPRVITGPDKQVTGRHDYLPFGEEITSGTGARTPEHYYGTDNVRQQFTSKERDPETGLDYFGARYYSSLQARFTTTDPYTPILNSKDKEEFMKYLGQPGQWNRYAYVANNPLAYVDPTGQRLELTGDIAAAFERLKAIVGKAAHLLETYQENGKTYVRYKGNQVDDLKNINALMKADPNGINVYIEKIIKSPEKTIEFGVAEKFDTKFRKGVQTGGGDCGGGCTVGAEESLTGNTQIFVSKDASGHAEYRANDIHHRIKFTPGVGTVWFENDIVDAHEFGHAFANAFEGKPVRLSSDTYQRAVDFENHQRARPEYKERRKIRRIKE